VVRRSHVCTLDSPCSRHRPKPSLLPNRRSIDLLDCLTDSDTVPATELALLPDTNLNCRGIAYQRILYRKAQVRSDNKQVPHLARNSSVLPWPS